MGLHKHSSADSSLFGNPELGGVMVSYYSWKTKPRRGYAA